MVGLHAGFGMRVHTERFERADTLSISSQDICGNKFQFENPTSHALNEGVYLLGVNFDFDTPSQIAEFPSSQADANKPCEHHAPHHQSKANESGQGFRQ